MRAIRILDVTDLATFDRVPRCADPGFDHRSCDYWEDADRGSKAARLAWLEAGPPPAATPQPGPADNPFAPSPRDHVSPIRAAAPPAPGCTRARLRD